MFPHHYHRLIDSVFYMVIEGDNHERERPYKYLWYITGSHHQPAWGETHTLSGAKEAAESAMRRFMKTSKYEECKGESIDESCDKMHE